MRPVEGLAYLQLPECLGNRDELHHIVLDYGAAAAVAQVKTSAPMYGEEKDKLSIVRGLIRLGRGWFCSSRFYGRANVVKGWSKLGLVGRGVASPIFECVCADMGMHVLTLSGTVMTTICLWAPGWIGGYKPKMIRKANTRAFVHRRSYDKAVGCCWKGRTRESELWAIALVGAGRKGLTYQVKKSTMS